MVQQLLHHMDSDPVWTSSSSATVTESSTSLNEGQTLTITVNTTNVDDGLVLYWTVDQHTGSINISDFNAYSGTVTITNSTGTITIDISEDATTEGEEKFAVKLYTEEEYTNNVANTNVITINDTSNTIPTYDFRVTQSGSNTAVTSMNESSNGLLKLDTTNVADPTVFYWEIDTLSSSETADFSATTGQITVSGGSGVYAFTVIGDNTTEGNESFLFRLYSDSNRTTQVAVTNTITIQDTSTTPVTTVSGQQEWTTAGTHTFTVPSNVYSICVVCVGGGGGGSNGNNFNAGSGGGLGWKNNIAVSPSQQYTITVGAAGQGNSSGGTDGGDSIFPGGVSGLCRGYGGDGNDGSGGGYIGDGGGNGGRYVTYGGGGGAGGYSGNGGGGDNTGTVTGGGGGGGAANGLTGGGAGGGGVGLQGEGTSGQNYQGGTWNVTTYGATMYGGGGGSGGSNGGNGIAPTFNNGYSGVVAGLAGGGYGGGGGGCNGNGAWGTCQGSNGAGGAVRIIWGPNRAFPSTNTSDV
tara:strand:+ start:17041 stop:18606 length:1566 start_codon:yes stop_codon:yes gene_type:complete